jgi:hypothetical protein
MNDREVTPGFRHKIPNFKGGVIDSLMVSCDYDYVLLLETPVLLLLRNQGVL